MDFSGSLIWISNMDLIHGLWMIMDRDLIFGAPKKEGIHGDDCTVGFHCWLHWFSALGALQLCGWSTNLPMEDTARNFGKKMWI